MNVRELRKASGMTQQQFGVYFGIPKRTIQNWEARCDNGNKCTDYLLDLMKYKLINEGLIRADMERRGENAVL